MAKSKRLGIAGLGTVGVGVVKRLAAEADLMAERCGCSITITAVSARQKAKDRGIDISGFEWHDTPQTLAVSPAIDVFVELIGGADGPALEAVSAALQAGKHVVTANKALMAIHGDTLANLAEERGVALNYEAAVAGGIPIIKGIREGLVSNKVERLYGILNGTCNYILTNMEETGRAFSDVLEEAQEKGYAEADPSFDIGGIDAAHKLAILASLAFGKKVNFDAVTIEGIEAIAASDITFAKELGYCIKLLGLAADTPNGVEQRVHPCLVHRDRPIAAVDGVTNAVIVECDQVGRLVFKGPGAGQDATASAVLADIGDIAKGLIQPTFMTPATSLTPLNGAEMDAREGAYYLRLTALDKPGVMAEITQDLADEGVSLDSIIQRGSEGSESVPIVLITHICRESVMKRAIERIAAHEAIVRPPRMIRIENL